MCVRIPEIRWVESHPDWSCKTASTEKQVEMGQEFKNNCYLCIRLNEHLKTMLELTLQQHKVHLLCEGNTHLEISISFR